MAGAYGLMGLETVCITKGCLGSDVSPRKWQILVCAAGSVDSPWIPASAGMTEEGVRLRRTEGLVVDSPQADAGGLVVSPNPLIFPQDWGPEG